jgi:hypothetical protein
MTPRHIGIVACSAEGAALCYRTICVEGAAILGPHAHPEVTVHTPSLADYMACIWHSMLCRQCDSGGSNLCGADAVEPGGVSQ